MLIIIYTIFGIIGGFLTLWVLAEEPDKHGEIPSAVTAIIVGVFWPIVFIFVILGSVFNVLAEYREKNIDSPREQPYKPFLG